MNSLAESQMAAIGTEKKELKISRRVPMGLLNSQEVFRLVLFARWGLAADYSKKRGASTKNAEPENIHTQWADAADLMRAAIIDGHLEPLVAHSGSLLRVGQDQWPDRDESWWEDTFLLAEPVSPVPESLKFIEGHVLCFEAKSIRNWIAKIGKNAEYADSEGGLATSENKPNRISEAAFKRAYIARMDTLPLDEKYPSREDDMEWSLNKFGVRNRKPIRNLREVLVNADWKRIGRPPGRK